jgi:hypothetical protein
MIHAALMKVEDEHIFENSLDGNDPITHNYRAWSRDQLLIDLMVVVESNMLPQVSINRAIKHLNDITGLRISTDLCAARCQ